MKCSPAVGAGILIFQNYGATTESHPYKIRIVTVGGFFHHANSRGLVSLSTPGPYSHRLAFSAWQFYTG